jgi:hypothetical protein
MRKRGKMVVMLTGVVLVVVLLWIVNRAPGTEGGWQIMVQNEEGEVIREARAELYGVWRYPGLGRLSFLPRRLRERRKEIFIQSRDGNLYVPYRLAKEMFTPVMVRADGYNVGYAKLDESQTAGHAERQTNCVYCILWRTNSARRTK